MAQSRIPDAGRSSGSVGPGEAGAARATASGSEERFRAALDSLADACAMLGAFRDDEGRIVDFRCEFVNAAFCSAVGMSREELEGGRLLERFPAHRESGLFDAYCDVVEAGEPLYREGVMYRDSVGGHEMRLLFDLWAVKLGDGCAVAGRSVSERLRHEAEREQLQARLMRVYALGVAASAAIVHAGSAEELSQGICEVAVGTAGYALAVVGLVDRERGLVTPVASSGARSYLEGLQISITPDQATSWGPTGTALRDGQVVICNDIAGDPLMDPWRERALAYGFAASAAFPLLGDDGVVGVFSVYATAAGWFSDEESALLEQLAADMSFALRAKRHELALASTERFLKVLTDSMAEGMFALDDRGSVTYVNRAAERMLGWSEDELVGRSLHDAVHHEHEDGEECPLLRVGHQRTSIWIEDDVFAGKAGETLAVAYSASPILNGGSHGSVVVFSDISERKEQDRRRQQELEALSWVGRIRDALDEDRLVMYAQPIIDVHTREVVSQELLLRMLDRQGTIVAPGRFLPAAERYGLIGEVDLWVVEQAARYAAQGWPVSFNLSGDSLGHSELVARILALLQASGADPARLVCEITETALATEPAIAEASVGLLAAHGCAIALDDFGTGYGGFTYLKGVPAQFIKIDVDFVRHLPESEQNQHVVKAIVNLAQGFEKTTVAEGVEDEATLQLLARYGVDRAQGYAIARPAPAEEVLGNGRRC